MTEKKEILKNRTHNAERRRFIFNSAAVAGAAVIVPTVGVAKQAQQDRQQLSTLSSYDGQYRHIVDVLNKYAAKSKRVDSAHIDAFARGFIDQNGDIDCKKTFDGVHGEYKLVKLFMKSMNRSFG